jgi:type IV pilus assembly protein PilA
MARRLETTQELHRTDEGVTIIELMAALLVIGILIAIAVPTFGHVRSKAQDTAAQREARQAVLTQKTYYAGNGEYGAAEEVQPTEPNVKFEDLDKSKPQVLGRVYVKVDQGKAVATMVSRSGTGICYWVREAAGTATTFAKGGCDDTPPASAFGPEW